MKCIKNKVTFKTIRVKDEFATNAVKSGLYNYAPKFDYKANKRKADDRRQRAKENRIREAGKKQKKGKIDRVY